jgi:hypothetical protein
VNLTIRSTTAKITDNGKYATFDVEWYGDIPQKWQIKSEMSKRRLEMRKNNIHFIKEAEECYFDHTTREKIQVFHKLYPKF